MDVQNNAAVDMMEKSKPPAEDQTELTTSEAGGLGAVQDIDPRDGRRRK